MNKKLLSIIIFSLLWCNISFADGHRWENSKCVRNFPILGFYILKRESAIPSNEEIIRHNICNVELQPNICDV